MKSSHCYSADFETTTDKEDCRVWAYALSNIENPEEFHYGNSIQGFLDFCANPKQNYTMYFFNLKFDASFILSELLKRNYTRIDKPEDKDDKTFTTLITDRGVFYAIEIYFTVKRHHINKVKIIDAMKLFPNFSVERLAEGFGLSISKLELDYGEKREVGHELTQHEIDYIRNDVEIVAWALKAMFEKGLTKMTIASNAMSNFKSHCSHFKRYFPPLPEELDKGIRASYRGGFTYLNDIYQNKELGKGMTLDVNSLYPSVMKLKPMPIGEPHYFEGKYEYDNRCNLYIQVLECRFQLKPNKIPTIQIKHTTSFINNEYLKSSNDQLVTLTLTKPDLELFFEQYDVTDMTYVGGWKFHAGYHIFDEYIDYWMNEKIEASKEGNKPRRQIAKLLLNSLYGRFGISLKGRQKAPYLDDDGKLCYYNLPEETKKGLYIPVASFITAYARNKTIRTSQAVRDFSLKKYGIDKYWYSDTDSIKCGLTDEDLEELKDIIEIDDYKLGAWALEEHFDRFLGLRQKCYITEIDGKVHVTVAGLPHYLAPLVTFENFRRGFTTAGMTLQTMQEQARLNGASEDEIKKLHHKLRYTYVDGGVVLEDTDFTIK
ncbi:MAG: hypothetical protein J6S85_24245 [Methanobrevibacter sp.]|nr:hypothetical protein [Methanobrevibacter sp.]